ncbi:unnamed protein product [Mycena citricolor]|uniref:Uncharacterized protein n=1 Tax=Mycena citricolor TaxID=2018698 RepID=A0AAD2Q5W8_9AGAR|nr:unnamed protein product [Mycena citricolor]CAK5279746.1 unnamed protein product [Mycena citricolor]
MFAAHCRDRVVIFSSVAFCRRTRSQTGLNYAARPPTIRRHLQQMHDRIRGLDAHRVDRHPALARTAHRSSAPEKMMDLLVKKRQKTGICRFVP